MKNNRRNRKSVEMYFKSMNQKYDLTGAFEIKPTYLFGRKKKSFAVLIGSIDNPRSEMIWNINKIPK